MKNDVTMSGVLIISDEKSEILCIRTSGTIDRISIVSPFNLSVYEGLNVEIHGSIETSKRKSLAVHIDSIRESDEIGTNIVELEGRICKLSDKRRATGNRTVRTAILAVGGSNYIPIVFWNSRARDIEKCNLGDKITINGRLQSREFVKEVLDTKVTKTTYEVSVIKIQI